MIEEIPATLTLLVTANLRGDLHLLPRLFTLIEYEKRSIGGVSVLLDLGDTCRADSWICQTTRGRAPLLVLDSMGYDGAIIGGPEQAPIPVDSLQRLAGQIAMPIFIWNRPRRLIKRRVAFTVAPGTSLPESTEPVLSIDRTRSTFPANGAMPVLPDVPQGALLRVDVAWPDWIVEHVRLYPVSEATPPDSTIAAVVELVTNEARLHAQPRGS